MTTSTFEVGDLFSVLGARGIERQLQRIAGVGRVSVNSVSGSTTVVYDPGKTNLAEIQAAIKECGFHCAGEALPKHICEDHALSKGPRTEGTTSQTKPAPSREHAGHAGSAPVGKTSTIPPDATKAGHDGHGGEQSDAMAHEMGHGAGQDMQGMADRKSVV